LEIEKNVTLNGTARQIWQLLLDPQVMGACVPGMKSIDVISPVEYLAKMEVKISFLTAKFKIKTKIAEQDAPTFLQSEGTGEDSSIASSFKQTTRIWLTQRNFVEGEPTLGNEPAQCDLRMQVDVTMLGRIGSFGLNAMKTKADLMWDEFIAKLRLQNLPTISAVEPIVEVVEPTAEPISENKNAEL
jgi:uncharacterized protein